MAYIHTPNPEQASGEVLAMYRRQLGKYGYVPNYAQVFCRRPEIMALWAQLLAGIRRHIAPRPFELATFSAARALGNVPCSLAHGQALTAFFTGEEVLAIARDPATANLTSAEQALMKFARQVALDATAISAEDVAALRAEGFSDGEIFDIAASAAARAFFTKLLDALGVEPDPQAVAALAPEVRACLAGG